MRWAVGVLIAASAPAMLRADAASDLARSAQSPFEIQRFVETHGAFDWAPLWKALHLTDDTGLPECEMKLDDSSDCSSELIHVPDPEQLILVLRHNPSHFEVYLQFVPETTSKSAQQWRFTGHYQPTVKYFPPSHRMVRFGKRSFLTITEQGASGSGLSTQVESWLDLTQPSLQAVLFYVSEGNLSNVEGISRHVHGTVVELTVEPTESIKVAYTVDFTGEDPNGPSFRLGQREDQATYTRRSAAEKFTFDVKRSNVSRKQINSLYQDLDSEFSDEDFLRYDLAALKTIAAGPENPQKRWLRQFLTHCRQTTEREQLRRALQAPVRGAK